jgi:hypothetical protein
MKTALFVVIENCRVADSLNVDRMGSKDANPTLVKTVAERHSGCIFAEKGGLKRHHGSGGVGRPFLEVYFSGTHKTGRLS